MKPSPAFLTRGQSGSPAPRPRHSEEGAATARPILWRTARGQERISDDTIEQRTTMMRNLTFRDPSHFRGAPLS